jgi:hypothetical protein
LIRFINGSRAALCSYIAFSVRLLAPLLGAFSLTPPSAEKLWGVLRGETPRASIFQGSVFTTRSLLLQAVLDSDGEEAVLEGLKTDIRSAENQLVP